MKTLNKSNLIIVKEYNSNNTVLIQEVFLPNFCCCNTTATIL
jgi:hypothetical protein